MDFLKSAEGEILSRYFSFFRIVYFLLDLEKILLVKGAGNGLGSVWTFLRSIQVLLEPGIEKVLRHHSLSNLLTL